MLSIRRFKKRLKELNEFDMSYEMLGMRNGIKDYVKGILGYVDDLQESQYIGIDSAVITFRIPSHRQGELDHLYEGFMESPHTIVSGDGFVHRYEKARKIGKYKLIVSFDYHFKASEDDYLTLQQLGKIQRSRGHYIGGHTSIICTI